MGDAKGWGDYWTPPNVRANQEARRREGDRKTTETAWNELAKLMGESKPVNAFLPSPTTGSPDEAGVPPGDLMKGQRPLTTTERFANIAARQDLDPATRATLAHLTSTMGGSEQPMTPQDILHARARNEKSVDLADERRWAGTIHDRNRGEHLADVTDQRGYEGTVHARNRGERATDLAENRTYADQQRQTGAEEVYQAAIHGGATTDQAEAQRKMFLATGQAHAPAFDPKDQVRRQLYERVKGGEFGDSTTPEGVRKIVEESGALGVPDVGQRFLQQRGLRKETQEDERVDTFKNTTLPALRKRAAALQQSGNVPEWATAGVHAALDLAEGDPSPANVAGVTRAFDHLGQVGKMQQQQRQFDARMSARDAQIRKTLDGKDGQAKVHAAQLQLAQINKEIKDRTGDVKLHPDPVQRARAASEIEALRERQAELVEYLRGVQKNGIGGADASGGGGGGAPPKGGGVMIYDPKSGSLSPAR